VRRTLGIGVAALLALCASLAALPASASAARGLLTGFSDPDEYQGFDIAARPLWMQRTKASGAGVVRLAVQWDKIGAKRPAQPTNPADPAYDWTSVDGAVRDAAAAGIEVLLTINKAPNWAEGPNRESSAAEGTWRPNVQALADFSQALATRYSGDFRPAGGAPLPAGKYIEVWDEPNSSDWLNPQFEGRTVLSPAYYRSMLNASYRSIKSVDPGIQVVTGGTDPYGDPPGGPYPPGSQRVWPVLFWQKMLCVHPVKTKGTSGKPAATSYARDPGCPPALFDILAHHPIDNTGGGPLKSGPNKNDASTPDLDRVVRLLRAAEQLGTVSSGPHPVWVTEFWWDSRPPNPVGAPLGTQARWIEQSFYLFWKAGASAAINFQIADSTERPDVHAGLQAGIFFRDGRPKPSFTAFRFPFVTERVSDLSLRAWGKSPAGGRLVVERRKGRTWVPVKRLQVKQGSVFDTRLNLRGDQLLRARVGDDTSLTWRQGESGRSDSGGGLGAGTIALLVLAAILVAGGAVAVVLRRRGTPGAS
jgi:hypothetical protein